MSKQAISETIKTILSPEKEMEELQKKREKARGIFISQQEIESPTEKTIQKVEGLLNELKGRYQPPDKFDPEANNRRFGPK